MNYGELLPEEKLVCAIFGEPSWPEGIKHFLSEDGRKAVNDLLDEFVGKHRDYPLPHLHTMPASRTFCEKGVKVLRLRFGVVPLTDDEKVSHPGKAAYPGRTLDQVKVYFGVTRERIRQIKEKAIQRLRHSSRAKYLKGYVESE